MSFLGSIGGALKGVAKIGLPIVGTALGGPLGGAVGGALGGLVGGGGAKGALTGAALGGVGGAAVKGAGGFSKVFGSLPIVGSALGHHTAAGAADVVGDVATGGTHGGFSDAMHNVGGFIKNNPALVLGGITTALGAQQQAKAGQMQQQALDLARGQYASAQPMRDAALAALGGATQGQDLAWMTGGGNPYSRPAARRLPVVGGRSLTPQVT